jgi:hypothetical protein
MKAGMYMALEEYRVILSVQDMAETRLLPSTSGARPVATRKNKGKVSRSRSMKIQAFQIPISKAGVADMAYFFFEIFLIAIHVLDGV